MLIYRWLILFCVFSVASVTAVLMPVQQHTPPTGGLLAADKGYGVNIDLTRVDDIPATLDELAENGQFWIRQPVDWAAIETEPQQFSWQELDRVIAAVERANQEHPDQPFKLVAVLQTSPAWTHASDIAMTPPAEVSNFGAFARRFATRYRASVDYYQIWNAPNLSANWGHRAINPADYMALLREAAINIRAADSDAVILLAALAPTLEASELNLNEMAYLDQLYQVGARPWFDVVAAEALGFGFEPDDPARPDRLNFQRVTLLREVMHRHGDIDTPIWATSFGWNALPADWDGQLSPWATDTEIVQTPRTELALDSVRQEWPWLGPIVSAGWTSDYLAPDDPARGFALVDTPALLDVIATRATAPPRATPGQYPAHHPSGQYSDGWRFGETRADIPREEPRQLTIPFDGTRLDLHIARGPFRGYLWVTIDGQPSNTLPRNEQGSYVVLYDPLRAEDTVTLAQDLPPGPYEAIITAEGGWGQWAILGWSVSNQPAATHYPTGLFEFAAGLALLSGLGLLWQVPLLSLFEFVTRWTQLVIDAYNRLGERGHVMITFGLAIGFYLAPGWVALGLLPFVVLALILRPDLGLAVVAFSLSFFQMPKVLPLRAIDPVETALLFTTAGFIVHGVLAWRQQRLQPLKIASMDWAMLALVSLGLMATFTAPNFGVSLREWRVVVFESVLFYGLVRLGADFNPTPTRDGWAWRLINALIAGAVLQAGTGLYLYFFTDQSITAEGVRRAMGIAYGSPNNLALFLDRVWPILLALTLLPFAIGRVKRLAYGLGFVVVSVALFLTFSRGALFIGVPVGIVTVVGIYLLSHRDHWRQILIPAGVVLVMLALAIIPFSQTERFQSTFDVSAGSTGFFRLSLWESSLLILRDHWLLGIGLDNFLYQYRTYYILPAAWAEPNLSHPHNILLDFGTRLGIGGIVIIIWLQIAFWRTAWRMPQNPLILGIMGSLSVFLLHGLVDNSYFLVDMAFIFCGTLGITQRLGELSPAN